MNITFFTPTLKLSGGNIVMFKYAEALVKSGHVVTIIAPHQEIIDQIQNGVHIKTFQKIHNKYFEHIFFQLIYLKNFFNIVPSSDIIIPVFFPLSIHAIYCKMRGKTKKVISLFQDYKDMYWFGRYIYHILRIKLITSKIDEFITVSKPTANEIQKYTGRKAFVIPNGIEHEYFYPRKEKKENYLLFVGSSGKNKGLKYFLKAFVIIEKKYPDIKAKIVSQDNVIIHNDNIEIINIGSDRNKLGELYSKALIYVSQSYGDSFGLPPLEAMACGTATVITKTVGSEEYAINGFNSTIVPIKDATKTADAIIDILNNKIKREKYELEGIETAKKYNWEKSFKNFEKILFN